MCGISGIVNTDGSAVLKNEIEQMNDLISHRGPDGEGYYCYKKKTNNESDSKTNINACEIELESN